MSTDERTDTCYSCTAVHPVDPHILDIRQVEVAAYRLSDPNNPQLVVQFMTQQIDCYRNSKGEVVEGADDRVQAFFYMFGFVRDFDDKVTFSGSIELKTLKLEMTKPDEK